MQRMSRIGEEEGAEEDSALVDSMFGPGGLLDPGQQVSLPRSLLNTEAESLIPSDLLDADEPDLLPNRGVQEVLPSMSRPYRNKNQSPSSLPPTSILETTTLSPTAPAFRPPPGFSLDDRCNASPSQLEVLPQTCNADIFSSHRMSQNLSASQYRPLSNLPVARMESENVNRTHKSKSFTNDAVSRLKRKSQFVDARRGNAVANSLWQQKQSDTQYGASESNSSSCVTETASEMSYPTGILDETIIDDAPKALSEIAVQPDELRAGCQSRTVQESTFNIAAQWQNEDDIVDSSSDTTARIPVPDDVHEINTTSIAHRAQEVSKTCDKREHQVETAPRRPLEKDDTCVGTSPNSSFALFSFFGNVAVLQSRNAVLFLVRAFWSLASWLSMCMKNIGAVALPVLRAAHRSVSLATDKVGKLLQLTLKGFRFFCYAALTMYRLATTGSRDNHDGVLCYSLLGLSPLLVTCVSEYIILPYWAPQCFFYLLVFSLLCSSSIDATSKGRAGAKKNLRGRGVSDDLFSKKSKGLGLTGPSKRSLGEKNCTSKLILLPTILIVMLCPFEKDIVHSEDASSRLVLAYIVFCFRNCRFVSTPTWISLSTQIVLKAAIRNETVRENAVLILGVASFGFVSRQNRRRRIQSGSNSKTAVRSDSKQKLGKESLKAEVEKANRPPGHQLQLESNCPVFKKRGDTESKVFTETDATNDSSEEEQPDYDSSANMHPPSPKHKQALWDEAKTLMHIVLDTFVQLASFCRSVPVGCASAVMSFVRDSLDRLRSAGMTIVEFCAQLRFQALSFPSHVIQFIDGMRECASKHVPAIFHSLRWAGSVTRSIALRVAKSFKLLASLVMLAAGNAYREYSRYFDTTLFYMVSILYPNLVNDALGLSFMPHWIPHVMSYIFVWLLLLREPQETKAEGMPNRQSAQEGAGLTRMREEVARLAQSRSVDDMKENEKSRFAFVYHTLFVIFHYGVPLVVTLCGLSGLMDGLGRYTLCFCLLALRSGFATRFPVLLGVSLQILFVKFARNEGVLDEYALVVVGCATLWYVRCHHALQQRNPAGKVSERGSR